LHGGFDEFCRLAGSSFITACINRRFEVRLSESQNGLRAIRTDVLKALDLREDLTTIEQEMIIKTLRRGFRMDEVPTHEHCRRAGQSHIRVWRVAHRYVFSLVKNLFF
jgi:dolichol-phosphate mannosyltransferase